RNLGCGLVVCAARGVGPHRDGAGSGKGEDIAGELDRWGRGESDGITGAAGGGGGFDHTAGELVAWNGGGDGLRRLPEYEGSGRRAVVARIGDAGGDGMAARVDRGAVAPVVDGDRQPGGDGRGRGRLGRSVVGVGQAAEGHGGARGGHVEGVRD